MKKDPHDVDSFAAHLRKTEPAIADDGFTATVMTRLPQPDKLPTWQKSAILLAATALGSAIVAWQVPVTIIPVLLDEIAADWPELLGTSILLTYSAALAAVSAINRR